MSKDRDYAIYKVLASGDLTPMGTYKGRDVNHVLQRMGKSGNLKGSDWEAKYIAIPVGSKSVARRIPLIKVHSKILKNFKTQ